MKKEDRQRLWALTRDWPKEIRLKDVRKLQKEVPGLSLNRFLYEFQKSTGYVRRGGKLTREFPFEDPLLRLVAFKMLEYPRLEPSDIAPVIKVQAQRFIDYRSVFALMLLESMIWYNPILHRRLDEDAFNSLGKLVIDEIPPSPRWFNPRLEDIYERFQNQDFERITKEDFRLLNLAEMRQVGMVAWHSSWTHSQPKVERIFRKFLSDLQISSLADYVRGIRLPHQAVEDPESFSRKIIKYGTIKRYANWAGIKASMILFRRKDLEKVVLGDLDQTFIPIFYEREDGIFRGEPRLQDVNGVAGLCYSLPKARKEIINGAFKGRVFEDILFDILTGAIAIEKIESKFYAYSYAFVDSRSHHPASDICRYGYIPPDGVGKGGLVRRKDSDPFKPFLELLDQDEFQEDVVLIHHSKPKHVLTGQCKFTKKYSHRKYLTGLNHIKKFAVFLEQSDEARIDIRIPLGYPIVPCLFTSFSGSIYRYEPSVLKSTLYPVLTFQFMDLVERHLRSFRSKDQEKKENKS